MVGKKNPLVVAKISFDLRDSYVTWYLNLHYSLFYELQIHQESRFW